jgi:hypothetical protein
MRKVKNVLLLKMQIQPLGGSNRHYRFANNYFAAFWKMEKFPLSHFSGYIIDILLKEPKQHQSRAGVEDYDLLRCIDKGLENFGKSVKQTIYWKISILYGSPQEAIISNPAILVEVIRNTFRDSAIGVEKFLINEIVSSFGRFEDCDTLEATLKVMRERYGLTGNAAPKMILSR